MLADDEPHGTIIAVLSTLVVVLLFTPVKSRIQDGIDRLFYRERYTSRRALLRLSQELNADLDLPRIAERLLEGVEDGARRRVDRGLPAPRPTAPSRIFRRSAARREPRRCACPRGAPASTRLRRGRARQRRERGRGDRSPRPGP